MQSEFGLNYPAVRRVNERDKLMFLAVVGLLVSLVMLILLFSDRKTAEATAVVNEPSSSTPVQLGAITLFAPSRTVHAGQRLSNFKFKPVYWSRNAVPEGAVRDLHELKGMFAKREIRSGYPITRADISKKVRMETLDITPGKRAITIAIDAESGLEGWAKPGATVDVILTYNSKGDLTSEVIVENARVLSLGGDKRDASATGTVSRQATPERTITLEVTPEGALGVRTSRELGKLSLMMRSQEDDGLLPTTNYSARQIRGDSARADGRGNDVCGRMRVGSSEYIVECSGSIMGVVDPNSP